MLAHDYSNNSRPCFTQNISVMISKHTYLHSDAYTRNMHHLLLSKLELLVTKPEHQLLHAGFISLYPAWPLRKPHSGDLAKPLHLGESTSSSWLIISIATRWKSSTWQGSSKGPALSNPYSVSASSRRARKRWWLAHSALTTNRSFCGPT